MTIVPPLNMQVKAWCVDYALRIPRAENPTPQQIIEDARVFQQFINPTAKCKVVRINKRAKK